MAEKVNWEKYTPKEYESPYKAQIQETFGKIKDRKPFEFDVNSNALYDMYKNQAISGGRKAMQDSMANAQQMTGGYGNSAAQSVGQQTYQGYMEGLADKSADLYQMAYGMYENEGAKLRDQLNLLTGMEDRNYGRFMDDRNMAIQDADRAKRDQQEAYSKLMQMIGYGYYPNADELAGAGMTQGQLDAIWNRMYPAPGEMELAGGGYGGRGGGGTPDAPAYDADSPWWHNVDYKTRVENLYGNMSVGGATEQEKNGVLTEAVNNGNIKPWEAAQIAKQKYK